jgi:DNA primase
MAGLIPQAFIDDLLSRVDIVDIVDKRVKLRKTGKNYSGLCPFHQEKSPSFSVEPDKQFYYCFGCGAGGNAVGFVMNFESIDFPQAVETLAGEYGLEVPREASTQADKKRQSENVMLLELLERASKYYQYQLRVHADKQEAVDYLKSRGLSGSIAKEFGLGYAPAGWDGLLTSLGTSDENKRLLQIAGLVIEKENKKQQDNEAESGEKEVPHYYDRFRQRIIFPIRDNRGRVIAFGGRVLGDDKPKYLNSPETPVFHKGRELYGLYEARKADNKLERIIIVEGYMDVIALSQAGIHNAVATLGTASNANHLNRLFKIVSNVVFCFDGDDAGRTAAWRALQAAIPLMDDGRQISFLFLPDGEDPDSLVREVGKETFIEEMNAAMPLADFLFEKLSQGLDLDNIAEKAKLGQLARPLISQFPAGIYGQLMLDRLSELIGVDRDKLDALARDAEKEKAQKPLQPASQPSMTPPMPDHVRDWEAQGSNRPPSARGRAVLQTYKKPWSLKAIELILARPDIATKIETDLSPLQSADGENSKMLLDLIELVRKNPNMETYAMLGYFYGSPVGNQLTQLMRNEKITPFEGMQEEFLQIIDRILSDIQRKTEIEQTLQSLRDKLKANGQASGTDNNDTAVE